MTKELYDLGEQPPLGEVPATMHAWLIRPERFGPPLEAFQKEVVDVPTIADDEVLVYVMAAGINYNNVWAGLGIPVDVIGARNKAAATTAAERFHIGGSDASGIVYAVGKDVTNVKVGDEVVMHCGKWDRTCRPSCAAATRCIRRPSGSGATRPTTAASLSSPRSRRSSACPSRST
jgi:crotonyl-CoA carboxylase/reductase